MIADTISDGTHHQAVQGIVNVVPARTLKYGIANNDEQHSQHERHKANQYRLR